MKTRDWIDLCRQDRQNGKTTTMAAATKLLGGTLVCLNADEAKRVTKELECPSLSVGVPYDHLRGRKMGPLLFDPSAVVQLCVEAQIEIAAAETARSRAEDKAHAAEGDLFAAHHRIEGLLGEARLAEQEFSEVAELLSRLVANPNDADAIRAAKDLLPAEKGGYR